jgi:putative ABC transport system permease protein
MFSDLRQAVRTLLKAPGFTAVVVAVLALGIGANTAIFSIVYGVVLKPLPFADASRLVALQATSRGEPDGIAYPDMKDWAAQSKTIDRMAGYAENGATLTGAGEAEGLDVVAVTGDFFQMLGVQPIRGRWLTPADDGKDAARTVVISDALWKKHFGGRDDIAGQVATFDGQPATIVGVMPASFEFPFTTDPVQAWFPMHALGLTAQFADQRGASFMNGFARLRAGATLAQANAELATIAARLGQQYPNSNARRSVHATPLRQTLIKDYRLGLLVLLGAVGVVLLIACVNVANLLLVRGTTRRRELAIRIALGAGRARIVRQMLAEATVLAGLGGAAGLLVAVWGEQALLAASPVNIPRLHGVRLDGTVLLFVLGASIATALVFGLMPALQASRTDAGESLKDEGRGSSGARAGRVRQALVVAEIALSLVLLAGAGLLVRSLLRLQQVDPGFVAERAAGIEFMLPNARYPDAAAYTAFYDRMLDELHGIPGAVASGVSTTLPLSGSNIGVGIRIPGQPSDPARHRSSTYFAISPDYFKAMGIRLVRGRPFSDRDNATAPAVAIVSEAFARKYFPGEDPLGRQVTIGYNSTGPREIVGVVADVKNGSLEEPSAGAIYAPFPQTPWPFMSAVVRTAGDATGAVAALHDLLPKLDPSQPPAEVKLLTNYVRRATATPRFTAALIGGFAALAVLLAGFGLYGVMAYSVVQRRREIGIRMALGAQPGDVRSLVVGQAVRVGALGLVAGLAGALAVTRVLGSLLFGVTATDPLTYAAVCAVLIAVVLLAAYLPARRATRMDPLVALRAE